MIEVSQWRQNSRLSRPSRLDNQKILFKHEIEHSYIVFRRRCFVSSGGGEQQLRLDGVIVQIKIIVRIRPKTRSKAFHYQTRLFKLFQSSLRLYLASLDESERRKTGHEELETVLLQAAPKLKKHFLELVSFLLNPLKSFILFVHCDSFAKKSLFI